MAEVNIPEFKNQQQLAKYGGLAWNQNQSGDFTAKRTRLILSGNRYLKYYLVEAAKSVRVHDPVYDQYYVKKLAEPKQFTEKRALALTALKLVRLIFYLLKNNQIYHPEGGIRQENI